MKKILIIISVLFVIGFCLLIIFKNDKNNIKLSAKYYSKGEYIDVTSEEISSLKNDTYLLFVYNNYCAFQIPCDKVFLEFMQKYHIDILSIPFGEFKKTDFYKTVLYAPSIIIIKNNKIISYLDANSNKDMDKYQNSKEFTKWLKKYISFTK